MALGTQQDDFGALIFVECFKFARIVDTANRPIHECRESNIEQFTIMRIREENNCNVILFEHFVRIQVELEHLVSFSVNARS